MVNLIKKMNLELITEKEQKLEEVKLYLKNQFIGIDNIIDQLIDSVKIWYIMPELQLKPLIINLWGITGVAKTDLIRKFVRAIGFTDRFLEIQMDSRTGTSKIEDYLDNLFDNNTHGVLLLDEMQRFRTVDEAGRDNNTLNFQDLWTLLSDGRFSADSRVKQELMQMIIDDEVSLERMSEEDKAKNSNLKLKYHTGSWRAKHIKKLLKCNESLAEIMQWKSEEIMDKIKGSIDNSEIYEGKTYNKLLIIIAGNLDEAFTMANNVNDADSDADVYHDFSKRININNIKEALTKRFKPEQIARFGNIHLIYNIPNKDTYKKIIEQKTKIFIDLIYNTYGIKINISESIKDVIYKNGVYPAQGIRPLLSTINAIFENSTPIFLFEYMKTKSTGEINLDYNDKNIISVINNKEIRCKVPTPLDDIKNKQTLNTKSQVAGHEAGHAVVYALLFNVIPTQIVCATSNNNTEGFVGLHKNAGTKIQYLNLINVYFAGRIAEVLLFDNDNITAGASSDYIKATTLAGAYIRSLGMSKAFGVTKFSNDLILKNDITVQDSEIENLLEIQYKETYSLLESNLEFLLETTNKLIEKSLLTQEEFQIICSKFMNKTLPIISPTEIIEPEFNKLLNEKAQNFFNKLNNKEIQV